MKKKLFNSIVSLVLCFALIISLSFAYLTATSEKNNIISLGNVDIEIIEGNGWSVVSSGSDEDEDEDESALEIDRTNISATNTIPNQIISKNPSVHNIGESDAYTYLVVGIPLVEVNISDENGHVLYGGKKVKREFYKLLDKDGNEGVNDGWTFLSQVDPSYCNGDNEHNYYLYAYDNTLSIGSTTPDLFSSVKIIDYSTPPTGSECWYYVGFGDICIFGESHEVAEKIAEYYSGDGETNFFDLYPEINLLNMDPITLYNSYDSPRMMVLFKMGEAIQEDEKKLVNIRSYRTNVDDYGMGYIVGREGYAFKNEYIKIPSADEVDVYDYLIWPEDEWNHYSYISSQFISKEQVTKDMTSEHFPYIDKESSLKDAADFISYKIGNVDFELYVSKYTCEICPEVYYIHGFNVKEAFTYGGKEYGAGFYGWYGSGYDTYGYTGVLGGEISLPATTDSEITSTLELQIKAYATQTENIDFSDPWKVYCNLFIHKEVSEVERKK